MFGENEELGCLNFLTPEGLVDAARLVRSGKIFRLGAKIGFAKPPLLECRRSLRRPHLRASAFETAVPRPSKLLSDELRLPGRPS